MSTTAHATCTATATATSACGISAASSAARLASSGRTSTSMTIASPPPARVRARSSPTTRNQPGTTTGTSLPMSGRIPTSPGRAEASHRTAAAPSASRSATALHTSPGAEATGRCPTSRHGDAGRHRHRSGQHHLQAPVKPGRHLVGCQGRSAACEHRLPPPRTGRGPGSGGLRGNSIDILAALKESRRSRSRMAASRTTTHTYQKDLSHSPTQVPWGARPPGQHYVTKKPKQHLGINPQSNVELRGFEPLTLTLPV